MGNIRKIYKQEGSDERPNKQDYAKRSSLKRNIQWSCKQPKKILFSGGSRIFRWGGALTRWGGANLRWVHFLAKMYVKMKEIDPVGGGAPAAPPGSTNAIPFGESFNNLIRQTSSGSRNLSGEGAGAIIF